MTTPKRTLLKPQKRMAPAPNKTPPRKPERYTHKVLPEWFDLEESTFGKRKRPDSK